MREFSIRKQIKSRQVSELKFNCPVELVGKIPEIMMELIKYGDIPDDFSEEYKDPFQFYVKNICTCQSKYQNEVAFLMKVCYT